MYKVKHQDISVRNEKEKQQKRKRKDQRLYTVEESKSQADGNEEKREEKRWVSLLSLG